MSRKAVNNGIGAIGPGRVAGGRASGVIMKISGSIIACAAVMSAMPASAATYYATRAVGNSVVNVALATNGALGLLGSGDFIGFSITVTGPGGSETMTPANGSIYASHVMATATELSFDFDQTQANRGLLVYPDNQGHTIEHSFWGFETNNLMVVGTGNHEGAVSAARPWSFRKWRGVQVIASVNGYSNIGAVAGVPEPATWAFMIIGMGLVGGLMRLRSNMRLAESI